jgi:cytochrome P450
VNDQPADDGGAGDGGAADDGADDVFAAKNLLGGMGLVRDPHPRLHELREQCPVHAGSVSGIFGVVGPDNYLIPDERQVSVFTWDEVDRAFRDAETFSNDYYAPSLREVIGRTILEMDPPEHQRYRSLLQGAFTKAEMARWEEDFVRGIVAGQIDRIAGRGRGDLAAEVAFHYPINVIAVAVGLPVDHVPAFYEQAAKLTNVAVPPEERHAAAAELTAMAQAIIDDRRAAPRADLISVLVQAEITLEDGSRARLTDDEICAFVRLLVPAGAQTTYRTLTNVLFALLSDPAQLALVRDDPSLIPRAVEEGLRWEAPLLSFGRTAAHATEIAGQAIAEGTTVNLCVHSANRDPSRWQDPDRFDVLRPPKGHVAFGQGNHICLGIHFARMELRVAIEEILARLPGLRLDPAAEDVHVGGLSSRCALSLPCVWDPPPARTNPPSTPRSAP